MKINTELAKGVAIGALAVGVIKLGTDMIKTIIERHKYKKTTKKLNYRINNSTRFNT